jgi:hypothetical protein
MQPKSARNAPRTPKAFPPFPILKAKPTSAPHSYCHESDLIFGGNRYKRPNNRTKDCGCETGKASQKQFFFRKWTGFRHRGHKKQECEAVLATRRSSVKFAAANPSFGGPPHSKAASP